MCKLSSCSENHIRVSPSLMIAPRLGTVEIIILMGNTEMWNKCPQDNDPPKQQNIKSHKDIQRTPSRLQQ